MARLGCGIELHSITQFRPGLILLHISDMEIYRPELESLLAQYAHEPIELIIVPDVAAWTRGRKGSFSGNPPGMAIRDAETEGASILLRRNIALEAAESIVDRVCLGGHLQCAATTCQRLSSDQTLGS